MASKVTGACKATDRANGAWGQSLYPEETNPLKQIIFRVVRALEKDSIQTG